MPYKDKEKKKEYDRLYRLNNKEKVKQIKKEWTEQNKEKVKGYELKYSQSEHGIKNKTIKRWISRGILCFDFDLLYDIFLKTTHCEYCNVELTTGLPRTLTTKCLDHNHSINDRFNVRAVLCNWCNINDVLSTN
tara:strand:- start:38 stop:439 length:402 start_codon:yes stop_codon:yes gene_type:complete